MAWTTKKTVLTVVLAAGLALLLVMGVATIVFLHYFPVRWRDANIQGNWEGKIEANQLAVRLVLKVSPATGGGYKAALDSPDQGARDIPVTTVTVKRSKVLVELKPLNALFEGTVNPDGTEIAGQWKQAGAVMDVVFKQVGQATTVQPTLAQTNFTPRAGSDLQGYWLGTLKVGAMRLRLAFKISEPTPGNYVGLMDSLDQGSRDLPLTSVAFLKPNVEFELGGVGGRFSGNLNEAATAIEGAWVQAGQSFPLVLTQSEPVAMPPKPDATAYVPANELDLPGFWAGTLDLQGVQLRVLLKIARLPDGSFSGSVDSPDQGTTDIPITSITLTNSQVQLELKGMAATYHGQIAAGRISGSFGQGQVKVPLVLQRTNAPSAPTPPGRPR